MSDVVTRVEAAPGFRSPTASALVAALDLQSRKLLADVAGATAAELAWQPRPGMNTIGMLLAHIAVAEAHVTEVGLLGKPQSDLPAVIGLAMEDDGMPLAPDAAPPAALAGRELAFFAAALERARAHLKSAAAPLEEADLDRDVVRPRPDGSRRVFNLRWVLVHALEHLAGHQGQILVVRHLYRTRGG